MKRKTMYIIEAAVLLVLLFLSTFLLKGDVWPFLTWWLLAFVMGLFAMPAASKLFRGFQDRGWMFSKILAVFVSGFLTWLLVSLNVLRFSTGSCIIVTLLLAGGCAFWFYKDTKNGKDFLGAANLPLILFEELLFLGMFLLWTYLAGFHPNAYGTEKFMDYGFMEAMMRSDVLPARDLWYSEGHINYYYGGQYFAVFLTKLSGCRVEITYNLMRTFVAAFAFSLPCSLVYQMLKDHPGIISAKMNSAKKKASSKSEEEISGKEEKPLDSEEDKTVQTKEATKEDVVSAKPYKPTTLLACIGGITAGLAVSVAGNMHYVIFAQIVPWIQKLTGQEVSGYWFPDATRYIGYHPDVQDKTIHEFPCYSFILGDLHAHVVNIIFVLFLLGILYSWMSQERRKPKIEEEALLGWKFWVKELIHPHVLLACVLLGVYKWSNYWDFVIYFVVTGGVVLFTNIIRFKGKAVRVLFATLLHALEMVLISTVVILPFTLQFVTMVQGVALAQNHSRFYQLLILWGLPGVVSLLLIFVMLWESLHEKKVRGLSRVMDSISIPDLFALITGLCALGLVMIPELVYVRDIYENGHARANTMFKLTYQAYIMFGITLGYGIYRLLMLTRQKVLKVLAGIALFFWVWTLGYFGNSVNAWFGNVLDPGRYQGLYALNFLSTDFSEDAEAIYWLKENISDVPVVLEANGDSYSGFERVSATTGLPTILGWYVHEWLWRNDTADLNQKSADIETIYTSQDEKAVRELLTQYEVSYIFVGAKEREKYEDRLNTTLLENLGAVVFKDSNSGTFIVKV